MSCSGSVIPHRLRCGFLHDLQQVHAPAVRAQHLERQLVEADLLATLGDAAKALEHQAANGIEFLVAVRCAKNIIKVGYFRQGLDAILAAAFFDDFFIHVVDVVLVFDVAYNLFQYVWAP